MPRKRSLETGNPGSAAGAAPALKPKPRRKARAAAAGAGAAPQAIETSTTELTESERAAVERLAYSYWLERGCHHGSSEQDWFRAEQEILRRRARAGEADPEK